MNMDEAEKKAKQFIKGKLPFESERTVVTGVQYEKDGKIIVAGHARNDRELLNFRVEFVENEEAITWRFWNHSC